MCIVSLYSQEALPNTTNNICLYKDLLNEKTMHHGKNKNTQPINYEVVSVLEGYLRPLVL